MREIKFRAWHFKAKRMFSAEEMTKDQLALLPDGHFANISGQSTRLSCIYSHKTMLPLQFTGLHDKNGKEIYEGDIAITDIGTRGVVEFALGMFGVNWDYGTKNDRMLGSWGQKHNLRRMDDGFSQYIEIIGNIFQNPALMEADNGKTE